MGPHEDLLPIINHQHDLIEQDDRASPQPRPSGHQPSASNASAASVSSSSSTSNTDESESSYLDSLEEGRAPLLGGDEDEEAMDGTRQRNRGANVTYSGEDRIHTHRFPKERHKTWVSEEGILGICAFSSFLVVIRCLSGDLRSAIFCKIAETWGFVFM
jgi:hypothetical protein